MSKTLPPSVQFFGGIHSFRESNFEIHYKISGPNTIQKAHSIDIWAPVNDRYVSICLLKSLSGGGKSTFARVLYEFLGRTKTSSLKFSFTPPSDNVSISRGFIAQKSHMVLHWSASELLPTNPYFLDCFFSSSLRVKALTGGTVSELSGGEAARLYVCSALENLFESKPFLNFLILDEAFEGLDAKHTGECIKRLVDTWSDFENAGHLYILLITHMDVSVLHNSFDCNTLEMIPEEPVDAEEENGRKMVVWVQKAS